MVNENDVEENVTLPFLGRIKLFLTEAVNILGVLLDLDLLLETEVGVSC